MSGIMLNSANFSTNAKQYEIFDLPAEILLTIFKCYLSTNERKNVKLVCKAWFQICNVPCLLNDEVLSCLGVYESSDICELLDGSEREILNLKFQNVKFSDNDSSFWKDNGSKVRSINFIDCEFQDKTLTEIIISCANLSHLSLVYSSKYDIVSNVKPPNLDLDGVLRNNIIRENLNSLEIDFLDSLWISNYIIHQLFSIFPTVRILKISYTVVDKSFEKVFLDPSELTSRNNFTFSPILNYLIASKNRMEKLKLHFPNNEFSMNFLHHLFETLTAMTRLTELSINMRGTPQSEYVETFIHSKQLKSLEFSMKINSSLEKFLLLLLLSNSGLQFLKISFFDSLIVTNTFFHELMSSSLKSLDVSDAISVRDPDTCISCFSTPNIVLRNLSVCTDRLHEVIQSCFLHSFQNLHHLDLSDITHCELQSIFKYQTKLRSLILHNYHEVGIVGDSQLCGNRLSNIECLHLPCAAGYIFLNSLSPVPILTNLKYLHVELTRYSRLHPSDLLKSADVMPFLEGLSVTYDDSASVEFWLELCIRLSRLKYLYLKKELGFGAVKFKNEDYEKLFSTCSSLRVVVQDSHSEQIAVSYFFDIMKKKAVPKDGNYLYSLCVPKIGEFVVDWLNF